MIGGKGSFRGFLLGFPSVEVSQLGNTLSHNAPYAEMQLELNSEADAVTVMRHLLLCNAMKSGPFNPEAAALAAISFKREAIATMSDANVIAAVEDSHRRLRYQKARWSFLDINVADVHVWPRMGGRHWATGTVASLLPMFRVREAGDSRIWSMGPLASLFSDHLNILVIREAGLLRIDDGSHRAVAMALAGRLKSRAFVGSI